jgi:hypothetical protein
LLSRDKSQIEYYEAITKIDVPVAAAGRSRDASGGTALFDTLRGWNSQRTVD